MTAPQPSSFKRQVPNILTAARVGMVIAFALVLETAREPYLFTEQTDWLGRFTLAGQAHRSLLWAAGLFALAALTDALDGHLARRWNAISRFGRVMDPLADKLLVLTAFVYLASPIFQVPQTIDGRWAPLTLTRVEPWMVAVILGRELLVTSLRGLLESEGADASANWAGKAKMILQSLAVPTILLTVALAPVGRGTPAGDGLTLLAWTTTLVTALSAWPYIAAALSHARPTLSKGEPA